MSPLIFKQRSPANHKIIIPHYLISEKRGNMWEETRVDQEGPPFKNLSLVVLTLIS